VLLPVDGSPSSDRAVRLLIGLHAKLAPLDVRVLHVDPPDVLQAHEPPIRDSGRRDPGPTGEEALKSATALLDDARIAYTSHVERGYVAATVVAHAKEHACDGIIMGTRGMGSSEALLGSIARQVIYLAEVPVTVVK
jgi:nucleotide-binding universal stress UspA family protein